MRSYCFERFYNIPLKYRGPWQLVYGHGDFRVRKSQTRIAIARNCRASVSAGADFADAARTIEQIIPLIRGVRFDFSGVKGLERPALLRFQKAFLRLARALKKKNIPFTLEGKG